ncbi:MAG: 50S ribosomal protein L21 [Parcubacteria group bacterium GW2011_GWC1_45_9]|nr:MAG: 50S ribosomal protein L21 [Parcubacteria group bacterium GW2011_GWA1_Parcubacteria_45_10]KKT88496.1 MAG: 50S ribosomal protein L21 [Parcubacteria group bacterium GW2011_GWB1_45_10]KKU17257.1 MAG: 50S ribosomal protein L21 [Parcubacteria group bacterium GW2011_GWC1_45_9]HCI05716.1 50S ribosomal protein L21 [Patescibacteria group bacterium]
MQAVVKIKGHQYLVGEKKIIKVSKLKAEPGAKFDFQDVLAVFNDKEFKLGDPVLAKASVEAKVLRQIRARKLTVFKYGPKTRRRVKRGFRPEYTQLEIEKIIS